MKRGRHWGGLAFALAAMYPAGWTAPTTVVKAPAGALPVRLGHNDSIWYAAAAGAAMKACTATTRDQNNLR